MSRFVLRAIDPATASIDSEASFHASDVGELCGLAGIDPSEYRANGVYDLDATAVRNVTERYGIAFDPHSMDATLAPWHPIDDLPYQVHTNRELALMLAGKKPLAAFSERYPCGEDEGSIIPEGVFNSHVESGRIIRREHISAPNDKSSNAKEQRFGTRRVLYALPGEEWRIEAYLLLWKTAETAGWGEGFERLEGSLLGYEDWQNDAYIEWQKKRNRAAENAGRPNRSQR